MCALCRPLAGTAALLSTHGDRPARVPTAHLQECARGLLPFASLGDHIVQRKIPSQKRYSLHLSKLPHSRTPRGRPDFREVVSDAGDKGLLSAEVPSLTPSPQRPEQSPVVQLCSCRESSRSICPGVSFEIQMRKRRLQGQMLCPRKHRLSAAGEVTAPPHMKSIAGPPGEPELCFWVFTYLFSSL